MALDLGAHPVMGVIIAVARGVMARVIIVIRASVRVSIRATFRCWGKILG